MGIPTQSFHKMKFSINKLFVVKISYEHFMKKNCCLTTSWTYFVIDRSGDLNEFAFGRRPTTNGRNIQLAITIEDKSRVIL